MTYLKPFCFSLSLMTESGIDLEKPRPDQKSVGFLVSPEGSCSIAAMEMSNNLID